MSESSGAATTGPVAAISANRRRLMMVMLCIIFSINYLDRQIVVILQEPIKTEFALADWQLGLLTGVAFGIFYTIMGLPVAHIVDRGVNRVRLIGGLMAVWSALTALCGIAQSYLQFFFARMGVGLAEAGFTPASHALISDLYPKHERARALGFFQLGLPIGTMAGLAIGGIVAEHANWRTALLIAGLPGIGIALLFLLLAREPVRGAMDQIKEMTKKAAAASAVPIGQAIKVLFGRPAFVHVILATAVTALVEASVNNWLASFLIRAHHMPLGQVGVSMGLIVGISGMIGTTIGGWQASYFGRKGMQHTLWIPIIGLLLCIPCYLAMLAATTAQTALYLLFLAQIFGLFWTAPALALCQNLSPVETRARAAAVRIVAANLIGVSFGPLLTGGLSDWFKAQGHDAATGLRYSLMCSAVLFAWAVVHWLLAVRALTKEAKAEAGAAPPA